MGRVARYKKVKSIDPYAKNGSWKSDVGDCATLRRVKRKSKTALKLKEQKRSKLQRKKKKDERKGGGSNGFGDDEGYDLPPEGGDEFDMADLVGSVKKQKGKKIELWDASIAALPTVRSSASHTVVAKPAAKKDGKKQPSAKKPKAQPKYDGTTKITHRTPTSEILAVHSSGTSKTKRAAATGAVEEAAAYGASKQERRKAFFEKKKAKKRRRGMDSDDEDDDRRALESLHAPSATPAAHQGTQKQPKKHLAQQPNYTDAMVARTALDDQVERPPTFATLPRGAHKLAKNKKKANKQQGKSELAEEKDDEKDARIQREKREMEAMRERVMRQYAKLRESRRQGR